MPAMGSFRAVFSATDNITPTVERISSSNRNLLSTINNLIPAIQTQGNSIRALAKASGAIGDPALRSLNVQIDRMGVTGRLTSNSLLNMQQALQQIRPVNAATAASFEQISNQMTQYIAQLKLAEGQTRQATQTGGSFRMLTDVSESTAEGFRKMSSGAQGFMLASSALDRNITGLAFSLIFLQFSGFVKLSLAVAAVSAATIVGVKKFQDFIREGKRIKEVRSTLEALSQSEEGAAVALKDLDQISKLYKVDLKDLQTAAQIAARSGIRFITDDAELFAQALILMKDKALKPGIDDIGSLATEFFKLSRETSNSADAIKKGLVASANDFDKTLKFIIEKNIVKEFNDMTNTLVPLSGQLLTSADSVDDFDRVITELDNNPGVRDSQIERLREIAEKLRNQFNVTSSDISSRTSDITRDISGMTFSGETLLITFQDYLNNNPITPILDSTGIIQSITEIIAQVEAASRALASLETASFGAPHIVTQSTTGFTPPPAGTSGIHISTLESFATPSVISSPNYSSLSNRQLSTLAFGFAEGGIVGGDGRRIPIMAHEGEMILNKRQQRGLGGVTIIIQNNTFNGSPQGSGRVIAEEVMRGMKRNGSITTAPLVP